MIFAGREMIIIHARFLFFGEKDESVNIKSLVLLFVLILQGKLVNNLAV